MPSPHKRTGASSTPRKSCGSNRARQMQTATRFCAKPKRLVIGLAHEHHVVVPQHLSFEGMVHHSLPMPRADCGYIHRKRSQPEPARRTAITFPSHVPSPPRFAQGRECKPSAGKRSSRNRCEACVGACAEARRAGLAGGNVSRNFSANGDHDSLQQIDRDEVN